MRSYNNNSKKTIIIIEQSMFFMIPSFVAHCSRVICWYFVYVWNRKNVQPSFSCTISLWVHKRKNMCMLKYMNWNPNILCVWHSDQISGICYKWNITSNTNHSKKKEHLFFALSLSLLYIQYSFSYITPRSFQSIVFSFLFFESDTQIYLRYFKCCLFLTIPHTHSAYAA